MTRNAIVLLGALLAASLLVGCAGVNANPDELPELATTSDSRIQDLSTVLRELRQSTWADEAAPDLDRAQVWLQRCEALRALPDEDRDKIDLYLEAVNGQLVQIRAFYARREAEASLESRRSSYEEQMKAIEILRNENTSLQGTEETP